MSFLVNGTTRAAQTAIFGDPVTKPLKRVICLVSTWIMSQAVLTGSAARFCRLQVLESSRPRALSTCPTQSELPGPWQRDGGCSAHGGGQQRVAVAVDGASAAECGEHCVDPPVQQHRQRCSAPCHLYLVLTLSPPE